MFLKIISYFIYLTISYAIFGALILILTLIVCISTKEPSCVGPACRAELRFGYPSTSAVFGLIFRALYFPFHDRVFFMFHSCIILTVLFEKF